MNDAIYITLAKLDSLKTGNLILKCRVLLEIAQFTWLNHKRDNNCFKLTSEQYIGLAEYFIKKHDCAKQLDFDSCKENDWDKRIKNSPVLPMTVDKMILSPIENLRTKSAQYVSSLVQSRLKTEGELSLEICNLH